MFRFDKTKLMAILNKVLIYTLVVYVFIILGRSVWTNWALKTQSDQIQEQIRSAGEQNQALKNLILYYQSNSFKELEARQELGMKLPGEKAVAIPVKKFQDFKAESESQRESALPNAKGGMTNWQAWWAYFFQG